MKLKEQKQWGFLRETSVEAKKAGLDKDTGVCRTGLNEYLDVIFPNQKWICNKSCGVRNKHGNLIRPDYRCEGLKLIIEFDGLQHYQDENKIKTDIYNTAQYMKACYKVIRIPYFIQLTNKAIETIFGVKIQEPMFDESVPSMGVKGKNTPSTLCELGLKRMANEFLAFPEQYEVNVNALKSSQRPDETGVDLLENEYYKLISSSQILYHASTKQIGVGTFLSVDNYEGETTFFYQSLDASKKSVEDKLEFSRPQEILSRKKCIFFFDNPIFCKHFAESQYPNKEVYIYKVAVNGVYGGFPMYIIGKLESLLKSGKDFSLQLNEYWNPTKSWRYKEYLGKEMIVLEDISHDVRGEAITPIIEDRDIYIKEFCHKQNNDKQFNINDFLAL